MGERHSDPSATLLVLARGLHEQGDLDAVVDLELVEESGDVGLDRGDGEVQRRGDLGVAVAEADGERDVELGPVWALDGPRSTGDRSENWRLAGIS